MCFFPLYFLFRLIFLCEFIQSNADNTKYHIFVMFFLYVSFFLSNFLCYISFFLYFHDGFCSFWTIWIIASVRSHFYFLIYSCCLCNISFFFSHLLFIQRIFFLCCSTVFPLNKSLYAWSKIYENYKWNFKIRLKLYHSFSFLFNSFLYFYSILLFTSHLPFTLILICIFNVNFDVWNLHASKFIHLFIIIHKEWWRQECFKCFLSLSL